jgi:hypothetical protein
MRRCGACSGSSVPALVQVAAAKMQAGVAAHGAQGGGAEFLRALLPLLPARAARSGAQHQAGGVPAGAAHHRLGQLDIEAALVVLGHQRALDLVALVEEGKAEGQRRVAEDLEVLGPGDHRARRHQYRQVAGGVALAREFRHRHHGRDQLAPGLVVHRGHARQHDRHFFLARQVVQRGDDVPAVDLGVVEHLRAVVHAGEVAQAHGVGRGEEAEIGMRLDHAVLVEQGELAVAFEDALDHEHHVRAAGIVFVEQQRHRPLQRPGHDAFLELGDLQAVRSTMASLPTRSRRLMWPSRFTRTQGQLSRAATCSTWVDLPVPCRPCSITRRLREKPARMASVTSGLKR